MIFADFGRLPPRPHHHHHGGGRGGGYYPMSYSYPTADYVAPVVEVAVVAAPGPCATWPTPPPPCPNGRLVWTDSKTVCCK